MIYYEILLSTIINLTGLYGFAQATKVLILVAV